MRQKPVIKARCSETKRSFALNRQPHSPSTGSTISSAARSILDKSKSPTPDCALFPAKEPPTSPQEYGEMGRDVVGSFSSH